MIYNGPEDVSCFISFFFFFPTYLLVSTTPYKLSIWLFCRFIQFPSPFHIVVQT